MHGVAVGARHGLALVPASLPLHARPALVAGEALRGLGVRHAAALAAERHVGLRPFGRLRRFVHMALALAVTARARRRAAVRFHAMTGLRDREDRIVVAFVVALGASGIAAQDERSE